MLAMTFTSVSVTLAFLLTGCSAAEPQRPEKQGQPKPLLKEIGPAAVVVSVGEFNALDNGVPIELLQVESAGNRGLCFDQIQVRGKGEGGVFRFGFTISKESQDITTVSEEVQTEPPTVRPEFFWQIPPKKAKRFPRIVIHDVGWIGDKRRDLSFQLLFTRSESEKPTCDAPPTDLFEFTIRSLR